MKVVKKKILSICKEMVLDLSMAEKKNIFDKVQGEGAFVKILKVVKNKSGVERWAGYYQTCESGKKENNFNLRGEEGGGTGAGFGSRDCNPSKERVDHTISQRLNISR